MVFLGSPGVGKTHLASAVDLVAAQHRFSTYYVNCHQLIEQLKKAHFENRLPDKLKILAKYKMLIIDEIGYIVQVHFSTTSKETFTDKVNRLLRQEIRQMMENEATGE